MQKYKNAFAKMFHRFPFLILISKNTSNIPSSLSISLSALKKKKKKKEEDKNA